MRGETRELLSHVQQRGYIVGESIRADGSLIVANRESDEMNDYVQPCFGIGGKQELACH